MPTSTTLQTKPLAASQLTPAPTPASVHASAPARTLLRNDFQGKVNDAATDLFVLRNKHGAHVSVCNYGARVVQIGMPDRQGVMGDVALGLNDLASLQKVAPQGVPSMGAFIGRYANRLAHATFTLDNTRYELSKNSGEHCIHGGAAGSRYVVFGAIQTAGNRLELQHTFTSEIDGFPGNLDLRLSYVLGDDNALNISWQATAQDAPTVASLTSHVFFNLSGDHRSVEDHVLQVNAAQYLPLNKDLIPTGQLASVAGTPFDFQAPRRLGDALNQSHSQLDLCKGFDHHYALDDWRKAAADTPALREVAQLCDLPSGRRLRVHSTEPGLQLFTANGLDAAQCGFVPRSGVCLEPSYFPDSPNQPHFPSTRIESGATRTGQIVYAFDTV